MAIETHIHDGSQYRKVKQWYAHDGTDWRKLKAVYCHDGTNWRKVFQGLKYQEVIFPSTYFPKYLGSYGGIYYNAFKFGTYPYDFGVFTSDSLAYTLLTNLNTGIAFARFQSVIYSLQSTGSSVIYGVDINNVGGYSINLPFSGYAADLFNDDTYMYAVQRGDTGSAYIYTFWRYNGSTWTQLTSLTAKYAGTVSGDPYNVIWNGGKDGVAMQARANTGSVDMLDLKTNSYILGYLYVGAGLAAANVYAQRPFKSGSKVVLLVSYINTIYVVSTGSYLAFYTAVNAYRLEAATMDEDTGYLYLHPTYSQPDDKNLQYSDPTTGSYSTFGTDTDFQFPNNSILQIDIFYGPTKQLLITGYGGTNIWYGPAT